MNLSSGFLLNLFPRARPDILDALARGGSVFEKYEINTPLRMAHFLAQMAHESASFQHVEELASYSAGGLNRTWPNRFKSLDVAATYERNPKATLNRAYADRLGNGDEMSGDGWRYRGRGMIQITGRDNYATYSKIVGEDLIAHPERARDGDIALKIACAYWDKLNLNKYADMGGEQLAVARIAKGINLGDPNSQREPLGLHERIRLFGVIHSRMSDEILQKHEIGGSSAQAPSDGEALPANPPQQDIGDGGPAPVSAEAGAAAPISPAPISEPYTLGGSRWGVIGSAIVFVLKVLFGRRVA